MIILIFLFIIFNTFLLIDITLRMSKIENDVEFLIKTSQFKILSDGKKELEKKNESL